MPEAIGKLEKTEEKAGEDPVITLAMERFKIAADAETTIRANALDDLKFRTGDQWPSEVETSRTRDGRPCLTMNRIPAFLRQITNEQRQQRPAVQINPIGDGSDIETAEILEGIVRHVEVNSDADIAYSHGFEMMATIGFGNWRIVTEYEEGSLSQCLKIKRIKNPFSVYWDTAAIEPCYEDAKWCFIVSDLPQREYQAKYPNSKMATMSDFSTIGDHSPSWASRNAAGQQLIRVAEYFYTEEEEETLVETNSGVYPQDKVPQGDTVIDSRKGIRTKVNWLKINGVEVLEKTVWPGRKYIPVIQVLGDDLDVDGKRYLAGMVRNAKDPQRMYNYQISAATEASALQPKAPFIAAEGQTEGHEKEWEEANVRNFAVLYYKATDVGGKPVPPPQRQSSDTQLASYSFLIRQADNDLKATTGIYDASLGEKGPDQSGRAILARQKQGDVANLNWTDNLARSIRHTGRVLIDVIPQILPKAKIQRIINPDMSVKQVAVGNSKLAEENLTAPVGFDKVYDLGVGLYDVNVAVGPNYQSKRQEAVASQLALVNSFPQIMQVAGDKIIRNMDWPGADGIADRMYKGLPPQFQDQDSQDPKVQLANAHQQVMVLSQKLQEASQAIQKLSNPLNLEQLKQNAETERESKRLEVQLAIAKINASKDLDKQAGDRLIAEFEQATDHAHELAMAQVAQTQPQNGNGSNGSQPQAGGAQPTENTQ